MLVQPLLTLLTRGQLIYLQWCTVGAVARVTTEMHESDNGSRNATCEEDVDRNVNTFEIDEEMAFSDFCETFWFGSFPTTLP